MPQEIAESESKHAMESNPFLLFCHPHGVYYRFRNAMLLVHNTIHQASRDMSGTLRAWRIPCVRVPAQLFQFGRYSNYSLILAVSAGQNAVHECRTKASVSTGHGLTAGQDKCLCSNLPSLRNSSNYSSCGEYSRAGMITCALQNTQWGSASYARPASRRCKLR